MTSLWKNKIQNLNKGWQSPLSSTFLTDFIICHPPTTLQPQCIHYYTVALLASPLVPLNMPRWYLFVVPSARNRSLFIHSLHRYWGPTMSQAFSRVWRYGDEEDWQTSLPSLSFHSSSSPRLFSFPTLSCSPDLRSHVTSERHSLSTTLLSVTLP